ncbi:hypothetical protein ACQPXB_08175 [Amycolatopsis sp. CA-161197]|uniref:hypothetical protein n=1 Tax=Amycolatopsis sp. CA-161197 TaxID=3239922 RepID=UPI003D8ABE96
MDIERTAAGHLTAGHDVDAIVQKGDERELMVLRETYFHRRAHAVLVAGAEPDNPGRRLGERELAGTAKVTPVQAPAASRRLIELVTGHRGALMRDAREAGASWSEIGAALGMSRQAAREWYQKKFAD